MPFRIFAMLVITVIALSALTLWVVATLAEQFSIAPVSAFAVLGVVALIASVALHRRNG